MHHKRLFFIFAVLMIGGLVSPQPSLSQGQVNTPLAQLNSGDPVMQCSFGLLTMLEGQTFEALQQFERGYETLRADPTADPQAAALCAFFVGLLKYNANTWNDTLTAFTFALTQSRQLGDTQLEWAALYGLGSVYLAQGRYIEAQDQLELALNLTQGADCWTSPAMKKLAEAANRNNLSIANAYRSNYERAQLGQDREAMQEVYELALQELEQALSLLQGVQGATPLEEFLQMLLGGEDDPCAAQEPDFEDMVEGMMMAMIDEVIREGAQAIEPLLLNNIGEVYRYQGQYHKAQQQFEQALALIDQLQGTSHMADVAGVSIKAIAYNNLGMLAYDQEDKDDALRYFEQALVEMRRLDHRPGIANLLFNIGEIKREQGDVSGALTDFAEAMELVESIQLLANHRLPQIVSGGGLNSLGANVMNGSMNAFRDIYQIAVALYHQTDQNEAAFYAAERGRARLFMDLLAAGQLESDDPATQALVAQAEQAYVRLQMTRGDFIQAQLMTDPPRQLIDNVENSLAQAEAEYETLLDDLRTQEDDLLRLISGQTDLITVAGLQAQLDDQTTLVSYYTFDDAVLGNRGGLAFVLTQNEFAVVDLPQATPKQIAEMLELGWLDSKSLENLYTWLVEPLKEADLLNTNVIGIVPHQRLHYVPFAALTDGQTYFGDEHALFVLPAASAWPIIQSNVHTTTTTLSDGVIFGNPSLDEAYGLSLLGDAAEEARAVGDLFNLPSHTRPDAMESLLHNKAISADIIHLAAHGVYNEASPLDSAIYLTADSTHDGLLTVREIYNMNLPTNQLVVLSACETNVGHLSGGDELVGLTRAFFTAGSPTVITSLWQVESHVTTDLMVAFYSYWQEQGLSKAQALQAAQADIRANDPHYWAAFVLNGHPD